MTTCWRLGDSWQAAPQGPGQAHPLLCGSDLEFQVSPTSFIIITLFSPLCAHHSCDTTCDGSSDRTLRKGSWRKNINPNTKRAVAASNAERIFPQRGHMVKTCQAGPWDFAWGTPEQQLLATTYGNIWLTTHLSRPNLVCQ
jgi:hypothetical protein